MLFIIIIAILLITILLFLIQKKINYFQATQLNIKKLNNLIEKNSKTIIILGLFFYLVTFPLYHPEKAKIKKDKMLNYELQKLKNDKFYKKKVKLDPKNSIQFKNKFLIDNLKDDKLFFQFPQRKKKRLELLLNLKKKKEEILFQLETKSLNLDEKNNLIIELNLINSKIENLERYFK